MSELLIVGCGGLGRMVGEVALATGKWSGVRFLDDAVRGGPWWENVWITPSSLAKCRAVAAFKNRLRWPGPKSCWPRATVPSVVHPRQL
ncbi:MAG: hypothetical protein ACLRWF_06365 [Ruthenibacterium sp.]